jgi:hypothetical protein
MFRKYRQALLALCAQRTARRLALFYLLKVTFCKVCDANYDAWTVMRKSEMIFHKKVPIA